MYLTTSPANANLALLGPGRVGPDGGAGVLLFDTSDTIKRLDLFGLFWAGDGRTLDWMADFLRDPAMDRMFLVLANPQVDDEPEEDLYSKSELTTFGSDVVEGM